MSLEPLNSSFEGAFLARLNLRVTQVSADRESMSAPIKILPLIAGLEFPISQDLIGLRLRFFRELLVNRAAVDQERGFHGRSVSLQNGYSGIRKGVEIAPPRCLQEPSVKMDGKQQRR